MGKKQKVEQVYVYGMREVQFERIMKIVHSEYDFDPVVTLERQAWWFDNSLKCLKGFVQEDLLMEEYVAL